MKYRCAPMVGIVLFFYCMVMSATAFADDKSAADSGAVTIGSVIELLKEKKVISGDEASALLRQADIKGAPAGDLRALVDLLREKGVLSPSDAGALSRNAAAQSGAEASGSSPAPAVKNPATRKVLLPSEDKVFIAGLKERWVKKGYRAAEFDEVFPNYNDIEGIIARMRVMGVITPAEAEELEKQYRDTYLSGAVTTVLENKEQDYLERIRKNVAWEIDQKVHDRFKNSWTDKIHLGGDFMFRYEGDYFDKNNATFLQPANPTQLMNSTVERDRFRIRARLRADADITDTIDVEVGLSTGTSNPGSPPTPMVTLGDSFNLKSVFFDRAFLRWRPTSDLTFWGGRFANPWFYTDLVWYPELNFDGVALQYRPQLTESWSLFFTAGAFFLQEVDISTHDKWLFAGQLGAQYKRDNVTGKLGVAFYDFENTVGVVNNPAQPGLTDWTAPQYQQKGNTLMDIDPTQTGIKTAYASEYKELNITGSLDLGYWDPVHVVFIADYVNNLGFHMQDVLARVGQALNGQDYQIVHKETEGFQLGAVVGHPTMRDFGDWKVLFFYKYLEADAVMDAFADQDFHLGGTNARGWITGGELGLTKNVWLSTKWFSANEISGPPLAIDVFQFNINARF